MAEGFFHREGSSTPGFMLGKLRERAGAAG